MTVTKVQSNKPERCWGIPRHGANRMSDQPTTDNTPFFIGVPKFDRKVKIDRITGCWEWQGWKHAGYGYLWHGQKNRRAHRIAYELLVGPIPEGLVIDHLCRNRGCVNPMHLELVTNAENLLRSPYFAENRTHCRYGHELTADNLRIYTNTKGYRLFLCRACAKHRPKTTNSPKPERASGKTSQGPGELVETGVPLGGEAGR